jgi:hypothetical protein
MKNHLFRDRAPITEAGWEEITENLGRDKQKLATLSNPHPSSAQYSPAANVVVLSNISVLIVNTAVSDPLQAAQPSITSSSTRIDPVAQQLFSRSSRRALTSTSEFVSILTSIRAASVRRLPWPQSSILRLA